jgi:two-component system sensor histidine kinase DesK
LLVAITAIGAATAWLIDAPAFFWITALVFTPLIGGVNLHFHQVQKADAGLRRAQAEIERLAAVAERERIARDLHDVLGHTLSLIILKSQLASKLADINPSRAAKEIREVEQVARTAMADVRETIRGYRTTLDDEVARARALLETAGIAGEFSIELTAPDATRDEVLAFVLREAVTNVVRHSGATVCRVRVEQAADGCTLTITDDGRGAVLAEGSGVRGMRERITAAGGALAYDATPGLRLTVTLPPPGAVALERLPHPVAAQKAG